MDPNNETIEVETPDELDPIAAMDEGIKQADELEVETPEPEPEVAAPEVESVEAENEPAAGGEQQEADTPNEVDAELDSLGVKSAKSRERFHELTNQVKEAAPLLEAIKTAGIELSELPEALARANQHVEWVKHVVDTGASPEQYGTMLEYLADVGAAGKGDMAAAERMFEKVMGEAKALASMLGKPIEGVFDPLDAHEDLRELVDDMSLSREKALQIAQDRQTAQALKAAQAAQGEQAQAQNSEALAKQAEDQGIDSLIKIDEYLRAQDPDYERKRPMLNAMVANIRATLPVNQWAQATQEAYATIPAMPAPKPAVGRVPVRGGGVHGRMQPAQFEDPLAALDAGIDAAMG